MTQRLPIIAYAQEAPAARLLLMQSRTLEASFPIHGHDHHEMELFLSGSGQQWINNRPFPFSPGSLVLLSPQDFHRVEVDAPVQLYSFHFPPQAVEKMGFSPMEAAYGFHLSPEKLALFSNLLRPLNAPPKERPPYYEQELQAIATLLLTEILRNGEAFPLSRPGKRLQPALKYIQAHHGRPGLRLEDAARVCGLSPCYFSSLFYQTVGQRFSDYVMDYRLRHACTLLKTTRQSVTDIAYASGFATLPHFFRSFRSAFRCTPEAYRNEETPV